MERVMTTESTARHYVTTVLMPILRGEVDHVIRSDEVEEPLPYEPELSDGIEADHAADEGYWGPLRWGGVA